MRVLITGGTGTLGHALVPALLELRQKVTVFSRDELKQSQMRSLHPEAHYILGDVRDQSSINHALQGVDYVIHAAAFKRIDTGERQPYEAIKTNVQGTANLVQAMQNRVQRAILISTDKAVYPINTYGMTKALAEKLFLNAGYMAVRYGNVYGSRGSFFDVIQGYVDRGEPIPITDPRMTRFWWGVEDAADFVIEALFLRYQSRTLQIPQLRARRIVDMVAEYAPGHPTTDIGIQPGEKLHEWMQTLEETGGTEYSSLTRCEDAAYSSNGLERSGAGSNQDSQMYPSRSRQ